MKKRAALSILAAMFIFIFLLSNALADEVQVAPGIKAMDPSNTGAARLSIPIDVVPVRDFLSLSSNQMAHTRQLCGLQTPVFRHARLKLSVILMVTGKKTY